MLFSAVIVSYLIIKKTFLKNRESSLLWRKSFKKKEIPSCHEALNSLCYIFLRGVSVLSVKFWLNEVGKNFYRHRNSCDSRIPRLDLLKVKVDK